MKNFLLTLTMLGLGVLQLGAQVAMIELNDIPGNTQVCVTNYGPYIASVNSAAQAGITSVWVIATNAVTKQTKLTLNGQPWQMSTSGVFAVATVAQGAKADTALQPVSTQNLATVESLYTLMATSRIDKVWEGTNAWWTFASNTITRKETINTWWIEANVGGSYTYITNHAVALPYPLINAETYSIDGYTLEVGGGGDQAIFSINDEGISDSSDFSTTTGGVFDASQNLTGYISLYRVSQTNSIPYYLQTNMVPPETWSYTDQTNWMADGQAGQLWATDLAADAATTVLNNHIAPILASPYSPWTTNLWAELGTATVTYACGNQPSLVCTNATVITLDSTGYGTSGVSRVGLSLYCGTNTVTFLTNAVDYATTPTLVTNAWNTILFRRVSADRWKGAQLQ